MKEKSLDPKQNNSNTKIEPYRSITLPKCCSFILIATPMVTVKSEQQCSTS